MDRHSTLLGMKDVLEHLGDCYEQWQYTDPQNEAYLIESMKRDWNYFRRLCESLEKVPAARFSREPQVVA